jgi:hypothetical protein
MPWGRIEIEVGTITMILRQPTLNPVGNAPTSPSLKLSLLSTPRCTVAKATRGKAAVFAVKTEDIKRANQQQEDDDK